MVRAVSDCPVTAPGCTGKANKGDHWTCCIILNWRHICVSVKIDRILGVEINLSWPTSFTETPLYAFFRQRLITRQSYWYYFVPFTSCELLLHPKVQSFNWRLNEAACVMRVQFYPRLYGAFIPRQTLLLP